MKQCAVFLMTVLLGMTAVTFPGFFSGGGNAPDRPGAESAAPVECVWTVIFEDEEGNPVPGGIVNFCTDSTCLPVPADENGRAVFTGAPQSYHLQVLRAPQGYAAEPGWEAWTEENGGEVRIPLSRQ